MAWLRLHREEGDRGSTATLALLMPKTQSTAHQEEASTLLSPQGQDGSGTEPHPTCVPRLPLQPPGFLVSESQPTAP